MVIKFRVLIYFSTLLIVCSGFVHGYNENQIMDLQPEFRQNTTLYSEIPFVSRSELVLDQGNDPLVVKVVSYNVQESGVREKWKDVVVDLDADVVVMQETGFWSGSLQHEFLNNLEYINQNVPSGPYSYFNMTQEPLSNTGGGTIISRFEIVDFQAIRDYFLDDGSDWEINHDILDATVDIYGNLVHILTIHYPCCDAGVETRPIHNEATLNYIDSLGNVSVIFTGDFNAISSKDAKLGGDTNLGSNTIDMLINPENPKTTENHTWIDVFRTLNPDDPGITYVDPFYLSRIDYIFANQFFFDKLVNATVKSDELAQMGSDHLPVVATFNFNPTVDIRPPTKVSGVVGEVLNSTSVEVTWEPVPDLDISYYEVFLDNLIVANYSSSQHSYIQTGLVEDIIYKFEVRGTDLIGNQGFKSVPAYMNTSYGMLKTPNAPQISGTVSSSNVTISWNVLDNGGFPITSFIVYRSIPDWIEIGRYRVMGEFDETEFVDDTVAIGKTYYYKVVARNLLGRGLESEVLEFTIPELSTSANSQGTKEGVVFSREILFSLSIAITTNYIIRRKLYLKI